MRLSAAVLAMAITAFVLTGCAPMKPVLYPNPHLNQVGMAAAQMDINECIQLAASQGVTVHPEAKVAGSTATGAAVGAATGAAVGAVAGEFGRGAAAGAAGGSAGGFVNGLLHARDPDPVLRQFVDQCLRDRGYMPVGWR